ncbi:hypothetical protein SeMB42_g03958 [Synchytrium endobioticum]|uniref:Uncharacterized protein n=1 Tax=Synchytrium endobioticum TaxID=286115 RepID=A0A507D2M1_9FUNG|nr:hypothetical protein SeMB42_g03958 [Synchytrium endobioticum]
MWCCLPSDPTVVRSSFHVWDGVDGDSFESGVTEKSGDCPVSVLKLLLTSVLPCPSCFRPPLDDLNVHSRLDFSRKLYTAYWQIVNYYYVSSHTTN